MKMQDFYARLMSQDETDRLFQALRNLRRVEGLKELSLHPEGPFTEWAVWPVNRAGEEIVEMA